MEMLMEKVNRNEGHYFLVIPLCLQMNSLQKHYFPQKIFVCGKSLVLALLIETIVRDFVPEKMQHYESPNYRYNANYKNYKTEVPTFLQNRPKQFILHCLNSITAACHIQEVVQVKVWMFIILLTSSKFVDVIDNILLSFNIEGASVFKLSNH